MSIFHFLASEGQAPRATILIMAGISGVMNVAMLGLVSSAAEHAVVGALDTRLLALYLVALAVYLVTQHYARTRSVAAINGALHRLRLRLADKVRRSDLRFVEEHGDIGAYAPLSEDAGVVVQGAVILVSVAQSLLLLMMVSIYLLGISPASLLAMLIVYGFLAPTYVSSWKRTRGELLEADHREGQLLDRLDGLLHGFKELALDRRQSDAVYAAICGTAEQAYRLNVSCNIFQVKGMILRRMINYSVLFAVVFVVPWLVPESPDTILKVAMTALFIVGPLTVIIDLLPLMARIDAAVTSLYQLERRIDRAMGRSDGLPSASPLQGFEEIAFKGVEFQYRDRHGEAVFRVGPCDLVLRRGERVFIVGGNGSGKSTLLKLLTGLYRPWRGDILLTGRAINDAERPAYRGLFSAVFTDFHLFEQLYGVPEADPLLVNAKLETLGLAEDTRYTAEGFSNLSLSSGQRKRLAFLAAELRDRPICIFDELGADQDPQFRRRLYEEILPELSHQGRTLVLVSHDDRYFHTADRVLRISDGRVTEQVCAGMAGAEGW
ncbi:MAG: cyclic peptide export ABC transporter [Thiohalocapsa sp.]